MPVFCYAVLLLLSCLLAVASLSVGAGLNPQTDPRPVVKHSILAPPAIMPVMETVVSGQDPSPAASAASGSPRLQMEKIVKDFPGVRALSHVDFEVRAGEIMGLVGENGAFYFWYDESARKMVRRYFKTEDQRRTDREKLKVLKREILEKVPGAGISADQLYRETDLAIDY